MQGNLTRLQEELLTPLLLIFVVLPNFLVFLQLGNRHVLTYQLSNTSILIVLFGIVPIFRVRYDGIMEVRGSYSETGK
jgi:hypothetical protein